MGYIAVRKVLEGYMKERKVLKRECLRVKSYIVEGEDTGRFWEVD